MDRNYLELLFSRLFVCRQTIAAMEKEPPPARREAERASWETALLSHKQNEKMISHFIDGYIRAHSGAGDD